jgi:chromosome segregation ATPase
MSIESIITQIREIQTKIAQLQNAIVENQAGLQTSQLNNRTNEAAHQELYKFLSRLESEINRLAIELAAARTKFEKTAETPEKTKLGDAATICLSLKEKCGYETMESYIETFARQSDPAEVSEIASALNPFSISPEELDRAKKRVAIEKEGNEE